MLRYHNWLPVTLTPAYADGYTCDDCGKDFLSGPLFHEAESGVDFCPACGVRSGLTEFTSLVSTLYFSSSDAPLADTKTHALALFAFAFSADTYGYFFSDASCLTVFRKTGERTPQRIQLCRGAARERELITTSTATTRMPWVLDTVDANFPIAVELHPLPQRSPSETLHIVDFHADTAQMRITLSDDRVQHFDSIEGIEIVSVDGIPVSAFDCAQPWSGTYDQAVQALRRLIGDREDIDAEPRKSARSAPNTK